MHEFSHELLIDVPADIIAKLIMNIEDYPNFLPWCIGSEILKKEGNTIEARLDIGFKSFNDSYVSRVTIIEDKGAYTIQTEAISGPFESLFSLWIIEPIDKEKSLVKFAIKFSFASKMMNTFLAPLFNVMCAQMVDAFQQRVKGKFTTGS